MKNLVLIRFVDIFFLMLLVSKFWQREFFSIKLNEFFTLNFNSIGYLLLQCEEAEQSALAFLKQEILDDNDEAPTPRSLGSIQKVPSISDLSDPEASLGKCIKLFNYFL